MAMSLKWALKEPAAWISLGLLGLEQVLVGASTYWVARFGSSVAEGTTSVLFFAYFVSCLLFAYVPGALSAVMLERWRMVLYRKYVDLFVKAHLRRVAVWSVTEERDRLLPFLHAEGPNTISKTLSYCYDLFATTLNVGINVAVVSWIISPFVGLGFFASGTLIAGVTCFAFPLLSRLASRSQETRTQLTNLLAQSWDTIIIGNHYNRSIWERRVAARFQAEKAATVREIGLSQGIAAGITVIAALPVFGSVLYLLSGNALSVTVAGEITATLPRMMIIVHHIQVVVQYVTEFPRLRSRLRGVQRGLVVDERESVANRIKWSQISIEAEGKQHSIDSVREFRKLIERRGTGRYTVLGRNGSGKTSLLLELTRCDETSYYCPAFSDLFYSSELDGVSSGQQMKIILYELRRAVGADLVLLDEWDASLDEAVVNEVSVLLNEWAKDVVVVEVRHRQGVQVGSQKGD